MHIKDAHTKYCYTKSCYPFHLKFHKLMTVLNTGKKKHKYTQKQTNKKHNFLPQDITFH